MSGIKALRYLLAHDAALIAAVPAARIVAGPLPTSTTLPAISVTTLSDTEQIPVDGGSNRMVSELVQVTVVATSYAEQESTFALVRAALPLSRGTVNGVSVDSILPEGRGPDFFDELESAYMGSIDFNVRFIR